MHIHSPCYSFLLYSAGSDFDGETFEEIWEDISEDDSEIVHEHLSASSIPLSPLNDPLPSNDPPIRSLVLWLTGFIFLLQARYLTSDAVIDALLKFYASFSKFGTFFPICCKIGNCTSFFSIIICYRKLQRIALVLRNTWYVRSATGCTALKIAVPFLRVS